MTFSWMLQTSADVPADDDWLSPREREIRGKLWAPKRVHDWRLGRWTAKRTLIRAGVVGDGRETSADWTRVAVVADEAGVPRVFVDGLPSEYVVSISHSGEYGLALTASQPLAIGCDVEAVGRRAEEFVVDWFTERERDWAQAADGEARSRNVTVIWSAKESALKALGVGLRLDTRKVEVTVLPCEPPVDGWHHLKVTAPEHQFGGWWRLHADRAITVVCDRAAGVPTDGAAGGLRP